MSLHLLKLCVGVSTLDELADWIAETQAERRRTGRPAEQIHTTRMVPKKLDDLLEGGSLYWVIKGNVQARQRLLDIRPFTDAEGIGRCNLVLEPVLTPTAWQPRRPFQGWRYLKGSEAPSDIGAASGAALPFALQAELAALGLL